MAVTGTAVERKKRTENRVVRRRQLIEATIASIAELGFSDTTLASVTKRAELSHGTINFYFKSKEMLFAETLGYLAQEHYDHWFSAMTEAGPDPVKQLAAIIGVDFKQEICSPEKLAVWFSFWGQVKYRPAYLKVHSRYDDLRTAELKRICEEIILDGDYDHISSESAARRIVALVDGLWLNILLFPNENPRNVAKADAFDFLVQLFSRHFSRPAEKPCEPEKNAKILATKG